MIKVLTIEREYGSGAAAIAQKVAARLGWKLWDQLLTDEIADGWSVTGDTWSSTRNEETRCTTVSSRPSCGAASKAA